jgi:hypothetical protein
MEENGLEVDGTRTLAGIVREHLRWINGKKKQGYSMKSIAETLSKKYDRLIQPNTLCKIVARASATERGSRSKVGHRSPMPTDKIAQDKGENVSAVGRLSSSSDFIERMSKKME